MFTIQFTKTAFFIFTERYLSYETMLSQKYFLCQWIKDNKMAANVVNMQNAMSFPPGLGFWFQRTNKCLFKL